MAWPFFKSESPVAEFDPLDFQISAKPVFCDRDEKPGTKLVVQFKILNQSAREVHLKRWGVRTTNLQAPWQAAFDLNHLALAASSVHHAAEASPKLS